LRADRFLYWIVRLMLIFGIVFGIGIFIGMFRAKFLDTNNTESHIILSSIPPLASMPLERSLGQDYAVINLADFGKHQFGHLNVSRYIGVRIELLGQDGMPLAEPILLNDEFVELHEDLTFARQWDSSEIRQPVVVIDGDQKKPGVLHVKGVFRVE